MSRNTWLPHLLVAGLGIGLAPLAMAWTPYGPGPWGGYPEPPIGMGPMGPVSRHRSTGTPPRMPRDMPDALAPAPPYPGYGPHSDPSRGYPGPGRQGLGGPAGFRISRATADDAYTLTIPLDGMDPETIQVHTQGHWLILRRTRSVQQTRNDDFGDGRGFTRSFSHSSGTASRRLSVPEDGILSAMSREDDEDSIRIRIPRRGRLGADQE